MIRTVGLLLVVSLGGLGTAADDRRIDWPADFRFNTEGVVIHNRTVAYMGVRDGQTDGRGSRVFQLRDGKTVHTDFQSKCIPLSFSPDGRHLLAMQIDPDARRCEGCPVAAVLIDAEGRVLWRTDYEPARTYGFSTGGEVVYAGARCGYVSCSGEAIDVYTLSGKLLRTVEPGRFTTVVVVGDGSEFLLVDDFGVRKLVGREELHTAWSLQVSTRSAHYAPRWISPDRLVVWTDQGRFILIDLDGIVVYEYDAARLAAADDGREFRDYAIVGMHAGPNNALWFWNSDRDFLIDPDSGNLTEIDVDRRIPEDFEMRNRNVRPSLRGDHFAWAGSKELLLRPLWNERETETGK